MPRGWRRRASRLRALTSLLIEPPSRNESLFLPDGKRFAPKSAWDFFLGIDEDASRAFSVH